MRILVLGENEYECHDEWICGHWRVYKGGLELYIGIDKEWYVFRRGVTMQISELKARVLLQLPPSEVLTVVERMHGNYISQ